ncbi:MAG: formate dehydrogenase accessory sulfurtransferase FdhD [Chloroherpetonaceae bacterium]|nr:formate dehydrogenase accessory sulfurtransferase FdhD [Chloroherpetonaceae bacterium]MDW8020856.1 formate dehydrogenase accessory sulfurtransferase FdhD [Chloroherpetonaceae bacterium]
MSKEMVVAPQQPTAKVQVQKMHSGGIVLSEDTVAVEEPLEIRLAIQGEKEAKSVAVTMRTPGHDAELAVGFLFTEGILKHPSQISRIAYTDKPIQGVLHRNVVCVELKPNVQIDFKRLERHFYTTSSCGVCGKVSIEAVQANACPTFPKNRPFFEKSVICRLPETLRKAQAVFDQTGGLHAAALFDVRGNLLLMREDVGRHNALDKLIGRAFLEQRLPLHNELVLVSGRASFELVQKALMAGIPILAAVGAPSSLAIELADEFDMTLIGFLRGERFNIYSSAWRVRSDSVYAPIAPEVNRQWILETVHLRLQPIRPDDEAYFFETWNDPAFRRYLFNDEPVAREFIRAQIEESIKNFQERQFGIWTLWLKDEERRIGFCALRLNPVHTGVELVYGIETNFWGHGYATEASQAVLRYALQQLHLQRVMAATDQSNVASRKVLEKIGMRFDHVEKGKLDDLMYFVASSET